MEYTFCKILGVLVFIFIFTPIGSKIVEHVTMSKQERIYRKKDKQIMKKVHRAKRERLKRIKKRQLQHTDIHLTKEEYIQACSDELKL